MTKVIVRTRSAGVHYGILIERNGKEVLLENSRRIWSHIASLSQLAVDGTNNPDVYKFSVAVDSILLTEAIEIIPVTERVASSIEGVPAWTA